MRSRHITVAASALLLLTGAARAASLDYQQCIAIAKTDAQAAYSQALAWHSAGGGVSAEHCAALALVQLRRFAEAAPRLEVLAAEQSVEQAMRAQLYDQAGNAWLLGENPAQAEADFSSALSYAARDVDVLADRARARAAAKNWTGAEADLTTALNVDPDRADLLVLRASARHAAGRKMEAQADIERALDIFPNYGDALVERGAMRFEDGNQKGAVADWNQVIKLGPRSRAAALAGEYLNETKQ
jgi:tetratricopeptide (TPR) repeat protein